MNEGTCHQRQSNENVKKKKTQKIVKGMNAANNKLLQTIKTPAYTCAIMQRNDA